jgi:hypothetical protein
VINEGSECYCDVITINSANSIVILYKTSSPFEDRICQSLILTGRCTTPSVPKYLLLSLPEKQL